MEARFQKEFSLAFSSSLEDIHDPKELERVHLWFERKKLFLYFPLGETHEIYLKEKEYHAFLMKKYEDIPKNVSLDEETKRLSNVWIDTPFRRWNQNQIEKKMNEKSHLKSLSFVGNFPVYPNSMSLMYIKEHSSEGFTKVCDYVDFGTYTKNNEKNLTWRWILKDRNPLMVVLFSFPKELTDFIFFSSSTLTREKLTEMLNIIRIVMNFSFISGLHFRHRVGIIAGCRNIRPIDKLPEEYKMIEKNLRPGKKSTKMTDTQCRVCTMKENLKLCSNCNIAKYCSSRCQKADWSTHKSICHKMKDIQNQFKSTFMK